MKTPVAPGLQTPPNAQQGFIVSAAQVTLLMVALVVSATAYALDTTSDHVVDGHAYFVLKAGDDLERTLGRAADDSGLRREEIARAVRFDEHSNGSQIGLFDARLRYGRAPSWPEGVLAEGVEDAGSLAWVEGEAQLIEVAGIDLAVCRRVNELLQGAGPAAAPPSDLRTARRELGWTQGCWVPEGAKSGRWFRLAFVASDCVGDRCRGGGGTVAAARQTSPASSVERSVPVVEEPSPLSPLDALAQCAAREAAAGARDPQEVAARCTAST